MQVEGIRLDEFVRYRHGRRPPLVFALLLSYALLCLGQAAVAATNLVQNGSFEENAASPGGWDGAQNELGANPEQPGTVANQATTGWSSTGRTWLYHNKGGDDEANFPDGDYAAALDGSFSFEGVTDVLAQRGLSLVQGTKYRLTFDMWGMNYPTPVPLDVRFTYGFTDVLDSTNGVGVTVLDDKTTVGDDGSFETVTVYFTATATHADYAVQFFLDGDAHHHLYIDNVELIEVGRGYELVNGSFEDALDQTLSDYAPGNELGGQAYQTPVSLQASGVAAWSGTPRTWYFNEAPSSTFPDGDWCAVVDASINHGGVDVLSQEGLYMEAGGRYQLTFAIWGGNSALTAGLDVRFAYGLDDILSHTNGTGVTVLDDKTTVGNDGVAEIVTLVFSPTVTENYVLQFFVDGETSHGHIWIDKMQIVRLLPGMFFFMR